MMGYYGDYMGGYGLFGPLLMIIFWGLIIWAVVALINKSGNHNNEHAESGDQALNILKERYAKGEINKEEYEQKKKDLS